MSLILNIDTAIDKASVCLAKDGDPLQFRINENTKDHAAWLHTAIDEMLKACKTSITEISAVAVNAGPGSYTGLRIGMSAAKGFCFALQVPLITVSSLKLLAFASQEAGIDFICPLIDARRMEVFTAVFDKDLNELKTPHALILDENSFAPFLAKGKVLFCGNAATKAQTVILDANAAFVPSASDASQLAWLSNQLFTNNEFADLAYSEPLYVKEFYSPAIKK